MWTCACDRCGRDVPVFPGPIEFCNCGPCEEEYQVSLWRQRFLDEHGWTEEAETRWQREFEKEYASEGLTYEAYQAKYDAYRDAA